MAKRKIRLTKVDGQTWYSVGDISERIHGNRKNTHKFTPYRDQMVLDFHRSHDEAPLLFASPEVVIKALEGTQYYADRQKEKQKQADLIIQRVKRDMAQLGKTPSQQKQSETPFGDKTFERGIEKIFVDGHIWYRLRDVEGLFHFVVDIHDLPDKSELLDGQIWSTRKGLYQIAERSCEREKADRLYDWLSEAPFQTDQAPSWHTTPKNTAHEALTTAQKEHNMATANTPANPSTNNVSPFDSIKQTRADGSEFWSARDLAPLMGYSKFGNFETPLKRAMTAAENQGAAVESAFLRSQKRLQAGFGSTVKTDYELTRFAAYLVAMNGDPNKAEVAAAQAYFAINTHENEVRKVAPQAELSRMALIELAMQAEKERLELEAQNKALTLDVLTLDTENHQLSTINQALEPKAAAYDAFINQQGVYEMGTAAKMLGTGRTRFFRALRDTGVFIQKGSMNRTPYQRYINQGLFIVKAWEGENSQGYPIFNYTTYVTPKGVDWVRKNVTL